MFGPITVPYHAVMLYNVCKLKEGVEWNEDLEFAIGEMCNVVRTTYDDFIAGQVLKYAGFINDEGTVGGYGEEGNHCRNTEQLSAITETKQLMRNNKSPEK